MAIFWLERALCRLKSNFLPVAIIHVKFKASRKKDDLFNSQRGAEKITLFFLEWESFFWNRKPFWVGTILPIEN